MLKTDEDNKLQIQEAQRILSRIFTEKYIPRQEL